MGAEEYGAVCGAIRGEEEGLRAETGNNQPAQRDASAGYKDVRRNLRNKNRSTATPQTFSQHKSTLLINVRFMKKSKLVLISYQPLRYS